MSMAKYRLLKLNEQITMAITNQSTTASTDRREGATPPLDAQVSCMAAAAAAAVTS